MSGSARPTGARGVYSISVAAELTGVGIQTLRLYEARGLVTPERTEGGTRRYSADDLDRVRRITDLVDAGLNIAGVAMVLDLEATNARLRTANRTQRQRLRARTSDDEQAPDAAPRRRR
ncbi:MAG TPA: MerR family transcriptional regulator [Mycobacteriales bacterium]